MIARAGYADRYAFMMKPETIYRIILIQCLIVSASLFLSPPALVATDKYAGCWTTFMPSEYGYSYYLSDDNSCRLHYVDQPGSETSIEWETTRCSWVFENKTLIISIKDNNVRKVIKRRFYNKTSVEETVEINYFDFKGLTISYVIDKNYINKYLNYRYKCNYRIKDILAMVPIKISDCNEEWCEMPFFKVQEGISKTIYDIVSEATPEACH